MIKSALTPIAGGPRATVAPTGSPFTYQNTSTQRQTVVFSGGTITIIDISRDGVVFDTLGLTAGSVLLNPGDRVRVTYLLAPNISVYPL